jgi:hypothetical protein
MTICERPSVESCLRLGKSDFTANRKRYSASALMTRIKKKATSARLSVDVVHALKAVLCCEQMPAATRSATGRSRQCNPTRVRRCLRIFFGHLFSNLGLFALVVGYVLLGALLFEFLEAGYELEQRGHIQQHREECLKELWLITGKTASV